MGDSSRDIKISELPLPAEEVSREAWKAFEKELDTYVRNMKDIHRLSFGQFSNLRHFLIDWLKSKFSVNETYPEVLVRMGIELHGCAFIRQGCPEFLMNDDGDEVEDSQILEITDSAADAMKIVEEPKK